VQSGTEALLLLHVYSRESDQTGKTIKKAEYAKGSSFGSSAILSLNKIRRFPSSSYDEFGFSVFGKIKSLI